MSIDTLMYEYYVHLCNQRKFHLFVLQKEKKEYDDYLKLKQYRLYRFNAFYCFAWRIIALLITGFYIYFAIMSVTKIASRGKYTLFNSITLTSRHSSFLLLSFLLGLLIFLFILIFLILKISTVITTNKALNKMEKSIDSLKSSIVSTENTVNKLSQEISQYDLLPVCYWNVAEVIIQYILNRRADTIKEAINLYEFELRQDLQFRKQMDAINQVNNTLTRNGIMNTTGMVMLSTTLALKK